MEINTDIQKIPSDELIVMTDTFHRSFNALGCDPMCHCCETMIPVGSKFKLATIFEAPKKWGNAAYFQKEILLGNLKPTFTDYKNFWKEEPRKDHHDFDKTEMIKAALSYSLKPIEVMLCTECSPETYMLKELNILEKEIKRLENPKGGCFRINGIINH